MKSRWLSVALILFLLGAVGLVEAAGEDEMRAFVDRFVAAQNAHDLAAVGELLWDSPQFLWITRGAPIWGRQPALTRFEALYRGTWRLDPVLAELRVTRLGDGVAQLYVPIVFTMAPPGRTPRRPGSL